MRTEQEQQLIEKLNESMETMEDLGLLPDLENIRSAIAKIDEFIIEMEKGEPLPEDKLSPWESPLQIPTEYQCQSMLSDMLYLIHQGETNITIEQYRTPLDRQYRISIYIKGQIEYFTGRTIPEAIGILTEHFKAKERGE